MNINEARKDRNKIYEKLLSLSKESLANSLLDLAQYDSKADDIIDRLTAPTSAALDKFRKKLADLQQDNTYYSWRQVSGFAEELSWLLFSLEEDVIDGKTGVQLVSQFFECDGAVFESCDDSGGEVSMVFSEEAVDKFVFYARDCEDKNWLCTELVKLLDDDDYGVRGTLLKSAGLFLPEENLRNLVVDFWNRSNNSEAGFNRRSQLIMIEELAVQLKDPDLFEKTRLFSFEEPESADLLDVAEVYFNCGDSQSALARIEQISDSTGHLESRIEILLLSIYSQQGDLDKIAKIRWKQFHQYRSIGRLDNLIEVIGADKKESIVNKEAAQILADSTFCPSNAEFLTQCHRYSQAEEYLIQWADQFDGDYYHFLLPLAQTMEKQDKFLVASLLYRSLLDSILSRGFSKAYHHGVSYLFKLDEFSPAIGNWGHYPGHEQYKQHLRSQHGRKKSFWGKYQ